MTVKELKEAIANISDETEIVLTCEHDSYTGHNLTYANLKKQQLILTGSLSYTPIHAFVEEEEEYGRCDTCGADCDENGCTEDADHKTAIE